MAAYDNYDYKSYWHGREYEHESEAIALTSFLQKIPKIFRLAEIGAGYGRLVPYYKYRSRNVYLIDPSAKLLGLARKQHKGVKFVQSTLERMPERFKHNFFDLIIIVRVLHHLKNIDKMLSIVRDLLSENGYFILELPNKIHWKALFSNLSRGNFTFPIDIFPQNKLSKKYSKGTLPFFNYHPDLLKDKLNKKGFRIIEIRSVSNFRSNFIKKHFPLSTLLSIEKVIQKHLSKLYFGPSIFILAQKKGYS